MTRATETGGHTGSIEITHPAALGLDVAVSFVRGGPGRLVVARDAHRILSHVETADGRRRMTPRSPDGRLRAVELDRPTSGRRLAGARGL